jgi:hypothetical protein
VFNNVRAKWPQVRRAPKPRAQTLRRGGRVNGGLRAKGQAGDLSGVCAATQCACQPVRLAGTRPFRTLTASSLLQVLRRPSRLMDLFSGYHAPRYRFSFLAVFLI